MRFPTNGKWWATRRGLSVDADGTVTVSLAVDTRGVLAMVEGDPPGRGSPDRPSPHWLDLTGTPDTLRRVAQAIEGQVLGAEINTPPLEDEPAIGAER